MAIAIDDGDPLIAAKLKGATIGNAAGEITWTVSTETSEKLTGYASTSVIRSLNSDGFASGDLRSLNIDNNGVINGVYTNGEVVELARISLANFLDPSALKKNGNYFGETTGSGKATPNPAGTGGLGEIQSNSLEVSNTDVAKEFINMITAQRAYQASAKIITTADTYAYRTDEHQTVKSRDKITIRTGSGEIFPDPVPVNNLDWNNVFMLVSHRFYEASSPLRETDGYKSLQSWKFSCRFDA